LQKAAGESVTLKKNRPAKDKTKKNGMQKSWGGPQGHKTWQ